MAREASKRVMNMRPYDVQLIGGMVLNSGAVAEMKTGEGKTLVAMLPAYLNALTGRGVHVVTVNDYLAQRDAGWNGLWTSKRWLFKARTLIYSVHPPWYCLVPGIKQSLNKCVLFKTKNTVGGQK